MCGSVVFRRALLGDFVAYWQVRGAAVPVVGTARRVWEWAASPAHAYVDAYGHDAAARRIRGTRVRGVALLLGRHAILYTL